MTEFEKQRVHELFLAALETPVDQRATWLIEQCGENQELLVEVRALLEHDNPNDDPLEKGLVEALDLMSSTLISDQKTAGEPSQCDTAHVDHASFLSKLSEVGVLSTEEIEALNQTTASGQSNTTPRQIASQLVSQGKLTDYQASALLKGQPELLIDKYLILDLLDAGGMGMVFKAIHRPMNRTVAVKMIAQHLLASLDQVKRFQREVRVAATLEHPNIVRSYDADQSRGVHFLVMEYVRGDNLTRIIQRQGPMSVEMAVDCIRQAAKGLRYAQKQGVIHRDIKPGNLMLGDEGLVKVLDLGLANVDESFRLAQQSSIAGAQDRPNAQSLAGSELTSAGTVLGTVSFMAPEQSLDSHTADTRADIYSLGCTLYYLLVGEVPYKGDSIFQVFMKHREEAIPAIRDKRPDVPEQVEAVCQKMLAKTPVDRFQSMGELLAAIEDCDLDLPDQVRHNRERPIASATQSDAPQPSNSRVSASVELKHGSPWLRATLTLACLLLAVFVGIQLLLPQQSEDKIAQFAAIEPANSENVSNIDHITDPTSPQISVSSQQYGLKFLKEVDRVELPPRQVSDFGNITIEAWIVPEHKRPIYSTIGQWGPVKIERFEGTVRVIIQREGGGWFLVSENLKSMSQLTHIAVAIQNKQPIVFVNGKQSHSHLTFWDSSKEKFFDADKVDAMDLTNFERFNPTIGNNCYQSQSFDGQITEFKISSSALYREDFSPQERFTADAHTLALYHFDEGTGDVLTDSSGNGRHGKIIGAQWAKVYNEANMSAADLLATGEYEWRVVERLNVGIGENELIFGADMTRDGRELVFSANLQKGGYGAADLWVSKRESAAADWEMPQNLGPEINSASFEKFPSISPDGMTLVYSVRSSDVMPPRVVYRTARDAPWSNPNLPSERGYPTNWTGFDVTSSNQFFAAGNWFGRAKLDIVLSFRSKETEQWPRPIRLGAPINTEALEEHPQVTDDGRVLVFGRKLDTNAISGEWYSSWRDGTADKAWNVPVKIDAVNALKGEVVRLLPDDRSLIFTSNADGGRNGIYRAELIRSDSSQSETDSVNKGPDNAAELDTKGLDEPSAADLLATGEYEWRVVEQLPEPISSNSSEKGGDISADGLVIVFSSHRNEGSFGKEELWIATRPSTDDDWSDTANMGETFNTPENEWCPALSRDGLCLVFKSGKKILVSTRTTRAGTWSMPVPYEFQSAMPPDPTASDLTRVISSRHKSRNGKVSLDLYVANRSNKDAPWSTPTRLPESINTDSQEVASATSEDGRLLLFERWNPDRDVSQIWMTSRPNLDRPWTEPVRIETQISFSHLGSPRMLPDGTSFIFSAKKDGKFQFKLYIARLVRKDAPVAPIKGLEGTDS